MREVDIVYLYEHTARELDVGCVLAALLRRRGVVIEILHWPTGFFQAVGRLRPKLVILPFCYSEQSFLPLLQYWPEPIFFNMSWEQLFYSGNRIAKTPRGEFSIQHVIHHSWSTAYAELLRAQGIPDRNIVLNGHPSYMFYGDPYRHYFPSREAMAKRYGLDPARKWIFFPENYNWAFYTQATMERFIGNGQSAKDIAAMREFCNSSLTEVLRWCHEAASRGEIELILRPRPATQIEEFKAFVDNVLEDLPPNLHIIQEGSVREWILASDLVVSSHSTSLIEAAVAKKNAFMLAPYPIPQVLHVDWHDRVPRISTKDEFLLVCHRDETGIIDHRLGEWARKTLMSSGDTIMNLVDTLECLITGKKPRPPVVTEKRRTTLAKRIIPEQIWMRYHRWKGKQSVQSTEFKRDIVAAADLEARINKWQFTLVDSLK